VSSLGVFADGQISPLSPGFDRSEGAGEPARYEKQQLQASRKWRFSAENVPVRARGSDAGVAKLHRSRILVRTSLIKSVKMLPQNDPTTTVHRCKSGLVIAIKAADTNAAKRVGRLGST